MLISYKLCCVVQTASSKNLPVANKYSDSLTQKCVSLLFPNLFVNVMRVAKRGVPGCRKTPN